MDEMTLSNKEMFEYNLELTKQRLLKELEVPGIFEWILPNARVINLPKDAPELLRANLDLAIRLAHKQDQGPIVLIPEPGFDIPWSELTPLVSGKRVVNIGPAQGGVGFDLTFDDGSKLMLVAMTQSGVRGSEQLMISVGKIKEAVV